MTPTDEVGHADAETFVVTAADIFGP